MIPNSTEPPYTRSTLLWLGGAATLWAIHHAGGVSLLPGAARVIQDLVLMAVGLWKGAKGEDADRVQTVAAWIWGVGAAGLVLAALLPTTQAGWVWEGPFGWMLALLVGAIPGCAAILALGAGHAAGSVPLHVLAASAVMTDGDAAAPVLARAPRAWAAATLASVPAATVVYLILV